MIASIFFFNDTATTEIYTLSLHDALPIYVLFYLREGLYVCGRLEAEIFDKPDDRCHLFSHDLVFIQDFAHHALKDRKSTRLNSSHANISYAVFCLKKKKHT